MALTKADIVKSLSENKQLFENRDESYLLVQSLLELIKRTIENGEDILISGFGKFCVKEKKSRRGRNPYTGEDLILDSRRVVVFKCSKVLQDKVNRK